MRTRRLWATLLLGALAAMALAAAASADAAALSDDGGAQWRVEQPQPPAPPQGVSGSSIPIGLGRIGDIAFWEPNRGALITAGNGSTIAPGVWFYDGESWRELATVCGASDGRIVWAGPDEFWTISNSRPGQELEGSREQPPLEDNSLCHFGPGPSGRLEVLASYASLAGYSNSYQAMHAGGCLSPSDCWFAGDALPAPQIGAFQLHWNGRTLTAEPYLPESHALWDMSAFEGQLFESVKLLSEDAVKKQIKHPPVLHAIDAEGSTEAVSEVPLYAPGEYPYALDYLRLGADENALWAAAGPESVPSKGSAPAGVTVVRYAKPTWSQVLGPETTPSGSERFPGETVDSIAAEPATESAWIALDSSEDAKNEAIDHHPNPAARALLAHVSEDGTITDEAELPDEEQPPGGTPYGPLGAATKVVCPAIHDCWAATTQGWLIHLSDGAQLERESDPVFSSEEPITFRPPDEGIPQVAPDEPPVDDSGLEENAPAASSTLVQTVKPNTFATVPVALLSHIHSKLIHGTTLQLSFHLAVKARVRLLAERRRHVIASTPTRTMQAGNQSLLLRLNAQRWPTKLNLQTHALAPLPTTSTREVGVNTVSTSLAFPNAAWLTAAGLRP